MRYFQLVLLDVASWPSRKLMKTTVHSTFPPRTKVLRNIPFLSLVLVQKSSKRILLDYAPYRLSRDGDGCPLFKTEIRLSAIKDFEEVNFSLQISSTMDRF